MLTAERNKSIHRHFRATCYRQLRHACVVKMPDKTGHQSRLARRFLAITGSRMPTSAGRVVKNCSLTMIGRVSAQAPRIQGVVRLQNITPFNYDDSDRAFITYEHAASLSKNTVKPGDVLIASLGDCTHPAGRACLYPLNLPEAINKADCFRLRADSRVAINSYIMLFMNSDLFAKQARKWTQGVTLQRINTTSLKRIYISCLPLEEQELISRKVNKALFLLATKREELDKLVLKKQGLMDDLLTGRVRVTPLLEQAQATTPA